LEGVSEDDELSHDCGDGDLGVFAGADEAIADTFEVRVESHGDEGRPVEGLTQHGTAGANGASAGPFAGLRRHGRETFEDRGLAFLHGTEFGHVGHQGMIVTAPRLGTLGQHLLPPGQHGITGDQCFDSGIDRDELGLDHNETRSWHGWHRHVSLVMLAYAMMAAVRSQANAAALKKKPVANTQKLIRWSIQEIRRLAMKVTQAQVPISHTL